MRQGINPGKVEYDLEPFKRHRVVIPVYIPDQKGYFRDSVEILRLCLESLCRTTGGQVSITVISNGSIPEVTALLRSFFNAGRIDQVVLNDHNWGKIDAVLTAAHGRFEDLLTIADHDVLFLPGWTDEVERIFRAFPEAGFVTPSPNPSLTYLHTSATILSAALRRELAFEQVVPARDLDLFARSIGRPDYFSPEHRRSQMIVKRDGVSACVGGGHFVFTLRREVVDHLSHHPVLAALGAGMTSRFDDPPDAMGVWRLATTRAYARHMGNVPEPWMYEEIEASGPPRAAEAMDEALPPLTFPAVGMIPLRWRKLGVAALRRLGYRRGGRRPLATDQVASETRR